MRDGFRGASRLRRHTAKKIWTERQHRDSQCNVQVGQFANKAPNSDTRAHASTHAQTDTDITHIHADTHAHAHTRYNTHTAHAHHAIATPAQRSECQSDINQISEVSD